ncbi:MAG: peptidoglycan DD-metalloendopeptidase family protein [Blastocatellia bacterium]
MAAVVRVESDLNQHAVSRKGARGYMQMMPTTFTTYAGSGKNIFDAGQNINAGAAYLKTLSDKYDGNLDKILAAYNAGSGNVDKYGGVPPFRETRNFVAKVKGHYNEIQAAGASSASGTTAKSSKTASFDATQPLNTSQPKNASAVADAGAVKRDSAPVAFVKNTVEHAYTKAVSLQKPLIGRISSLFGAHRSRHVHQGVDIAAKRGTPIDASGAGQVVYAGWAKGYGNTVVIKHQDDLYTRYAHADRVLEQQGETVKAGQEVATVGSTGHATGPHLHFEVIQNGRHVNPLKVVNAFRKRSSVSRTVHMCDLVVTLFPEQNRVYDLGMRKKTLHPRFRTRIGV